MQETTFGQCATLIRETVSPSDHGQEPYIGLEHIGQNTLSLSGVGIASEVESVKSRFRSGDILFGKLRPYFRKVVRPRFDGICSTDIWVVRPSEIVDAGYLFYLMASQGFVDAAMRGAEGTRMPRAQWKYVSRMKIWVPPLEEQRRVSQTLSTLDDKVDLNRRMSETIEAMAKALFQSWFIDFEPVRAKAQGRWLLGESLAGLPAECYELFPSSLVDSEIGPIPAGWEVGSLSAVVELLRHSENPKLSPDELYRHYSIPAYDQGRVPNVELGSEIKSTKHRVYEGVVLVSKLNPEIERVWLIDHVEGDMAVCSTEFLVLNPKSPFERYYIYCLLRSKMFRDQISSLVTGTSKSHQRAQPKVVLSLPTLLPCKGVVEAFEQIIAPALQRSAGNLQSVLTLSVMRDELLSKLVGSDMEARDV